jgi:hypothetical protein
MKLLTALIIANNYPDNILITSEQNEQKTKWAAMMYQLKGGVIHTCLISTKWSFDSSRVAEKYLKQVAEDVKEKYANYND